MGNPGKNKIMRYARMYVDGYDISGDARNFDSLGIGYGEVDMTGWNNTIRQLLTDKRLEASISGFQAFFNDTASSGAFQLLKEPGTGKEVAILFGGNAEPTYNDPAYFFAAAQIDSNSTFDAQAGLINASFRADSITYNEWPLGYVMSPATSRPATFQGTSNDNGGSTALGWHALLFVTVSDGGTWSFKMRHSTDDASFSDLGTFTLDGSVVGSEHLGGSGTVNQYVRLEGTRTSGTVTVVCVFARNM